MYHLSRMCILQYLVPGDKAAQLSGLLGELDSSRSSLGVTDAQISLTSLEEVFLTITKEAELEAAAAEGRTQRSIPLGDGSTLQASQYRC